MVNNPKDQFLLWILAWNIYIGTAAKAVRSSLTKLVASHMPGVIVLMEATNVYGELKGFGYQVVQLKPRPTKPGNRPGDANIAMLIRNDIKIKGRFVYRMKNFWRGPVNGWPQDPRVYRWVKLEWRGKTWKVGGAHHPFNTARSESRRKLVEWLRNTIPGRPTVLVIDSNMPFEDFVDNVAEPGGAKAAGHRIDVTAFKNVELRKQQVLSPGISNHPAMLYGFSAEND